MGIHSIVIFVGQVKQRQRKLISGAVVLLQLWAWERISIGRPTVIGNEYSLSEFVEIGVDPLGVRWTNVDRRYKDRKLV